MKHTIAIDGMQIHQVNDAIIELLVTPPFPNRSEVRLLSGVVTVPEVAVRRLVEEDPDATLVSMDPPLFACVRIGPGCRLFGVLVV